MAFRVKFADGSTVTMMTDQPPTPEQVQSVWDDIQRSRQPAPQAPVLESDIGGSAQGDWDPSQLVRTPPPTQPDAPGQQPPTLPIGLTGAPTSGPDKPLPAFTQGAPAPEPPAIGPSAPQPVNPVLPRKVGFEIGDSPGNALVRGLDDIGNGVAQGFMRGGESFSNLIAGAALEGRKLMKWVGDTYDLDFFRAAGKPTIITDVFRGAAQEYKKAAETIPDAETFLGKLAHIGGRAPWDLATILAATAAAGGSMPVGFAGLNMLQSATEQRRATGRVDLWPTLFAGMQGYIFGQVLKMGRQIPRKTMALSITAAVTAQDMIAGAPFWDALASGVAMGLFEATGGHKDLRFYETRRQRSVDKFLTRAAEEGFQRLSPEEQRAIGSPEELKRAMVEYVARRPKSEAPPDVSRETVGGENEPQYLKGDITYREKPYVPGIGAGEPPASLNEAIAKIRDFYETTAIKTRLNRYEEALYLPTKDVIKYKTAQAFFHDIGHAIQNPAKPFAEKLQVRVGDLGRFADRLADLNPYPDQPHLARTEGFAEFVRLYFTDYLQAMQRAPELLIHFDKNLSRDPKMQAAMQQFREMVEGYFQQSTFQDIQGMMGPIGRGPLTPRQRLDLAKKAWDDVIFGVFNKEHPVFQLEDRVVKALGDMIPTENFGLALEALRGVGVKSFLVLEHGLLNDPAKPSQRVTYDPKHFEKTGEFIPGKTPLTPREILKSIQSDLDREHFAVYILAKRGAVYEEKRALRLFGPNVAEGGPAKVVAELDRMHPNFEKVALIWDQISKTLLEYKWRSGLINTELYHLLRDEYPFYVSFGRYMDEIEGVYASSGRKGVKQLIKRIKGSERQIRDPYESLLKDIFETYHNGDRNRFFVLLDKAVGYDVKTGKMPGVWIEEKPPRYFKSWTDDQGVKHTQITYGNVGPDAIWFYKDGQKVYRKVLDAPLLKSLNAAGDNVVASLKGIDGAAGKLVDWVLFAPARIKRAGMTKSPGWILWNFFKDGITVALTSEAGYLQVPWIRGLFSIPEVILQTRGFQDLMAAGMGGSTQAGFNQEVYARTLEKMTERVRAGGGKVIERPDQLLAVALKNVATGHLIRGGKTLWETAEVLSQASEYANRVGEAKAVIKRYMKQGMSYDDALMVAMRAGRRVSLDFQQSGAWAITKLFTAGTPFLTSSLQGKLRWAETYFSPKNALPGGPTGRKKLVRNWTRLFIYTVVPSLIVWATHRNDSKWLSLEPWQRFGFLNFRLFGEMVSLPKSWEFAVVSNVIESVLTDLQMKDGRAAGNLANIILNAFDIQPDRYVPQTARLILEPLVGKNFWTGRPIISGRTSGGVPEQQVNFFTGPAERMLAAVLNNGFGLPLKAGYIGYIAQSFAGNLGEMAVQIANAVASGAIDNNYDLPTRDYWRRFLTGRFIKDQTTYTRAMSRFYDDWEHVSQLLTSANKLDLSKRPGEANELVATKLKVWGPHFKAIWDQRDGQLGYQSGIKKLRHLISQYGRATELIRIHKDLSVDAKRKQVNWLMYGMINAVQRFYGLDQLIVEKPVEEPSREIMERAKTRWNAPPAPRRRPPSPPRPNMMRQPPLYSLPFGQPWSRP
jgi:hypothetical protein